MNNVKVASLSSSLGFNIDTTDLDRLAQRLRDIRGSTALLSRNLSSTNTQLNATATRMRNLASASEAVTKFNNLGGKYVSLANKVGESEKALVRFGRVLSLIDPRLDKTNMRLSLVTRSYIELTNAVRAANAAISQTPQRTPRPAPSGSPAGGRSSSGGAASGAMAGGLIAALGRFAPAGLIGGTAISSAVVAINEIKKAGRAQATMEQRLLFSSKGLADFEDSLKFVRKEALRLGQNSEDLGKAFGQINLSSKLSKDEKKKLMTDASEYIMTMKLDSTDQNLIWYAINQMFSLGKMQGEEIRQLTERGVPRTLLDQVVMDKYNLKNKEEVNKLQEKGGIDPNVVLPELMSRFTKMAKDSGAFDKALNASVTKEGILKERFRQGSKELLDAGLDEFLSLLFEGLSKAMPYMITFIKGIFAAVKGIWLFAKAVKNGVGALASFTAENPKTVGFLSALLLILVLIKGNLIGVVSGLLRVGAVMKFIGGKSILLIGFLALWYLMQQYDKYMKGEDTWLNDLADWFIYLTENVRLFKNELILAWNTFKSMKWVDEQLAPWAEGILRKVLPEGFVDWIGGGNQYNDSMGGNYADPTSKIPQQKGQGIPASYTSNVNNNPVMTAQVMFPIIIQNDKGETVSKQNIPVKVQMTDFGGLRSV